MSAIAQRQRCRLVILKEQSLCHDYVEKKQRDFTFRTRAPRVVAYNEVRPCLARRQSGLNFIPFEESAGQNNRLGDVAHRFAQVHAGFLQQGIGLLFRQVALLHE
jgi:hypothetical protein